MRCERCESNKRLNVVEHEEAWRKRVLGDGRYVYISKPMNFNFNHKKVARDPLKEEYISEVERNHIKFKRNLIVLIQKFIRF